MIVLSRLQRSSQQSRPRRIRNVRKVTGGFEGSEIVIRVSDTGIGIPESKLPRIFERFYRVDKASAGGART